MLHAVAHHEDQDAPDSPRRGAWANPMRSRGVRWCHVGFGIRESKGQVERISHTQLNAPGCSADRTGGDILHGIVVLLFSLIKSIDIEQICVAAVVVPAPFLVQDVQEVECVGGKFEVVAFHQC